MRRKILIILMISLFAINLYAVTAGQWGTSIDTDAIKESFQPSKNVELFYNVDGNNEYYVIGSHHTKGTKTFGTGNFVTEIYTTQDKAATNDFPTPSDNATFDNNTWTSQ